MLLVVLGCANKMINLTDTVTIYNKTIESRTEAYYRTVVSGVYWESSIGANRKIRGDMADDKAFILIPLDATGYLAPKAWEALVDKSTGWTLRPSDYIVKGSIADEITALFTITSLKETYDDVLRITMAEPLPGISTTGHFEVSAK